LVLLPTLPGVLASLYPLSNRPWLAPIPIVGQYALAADALGGKPPAVAFYILAGLSAVACSLVFVVITSRLLQREQIIFGR
jgi:hypothetical protein